MPISAARSVAFDILLRVDQRDAYAGELLHSSRLDGLSSADRALTTELVMGALRWRSRLDEVIAQASSLALGKLDAEVLTALRLAVYQLRYLSRVPAHAAINESVNLVKRAHKRSAVPFANAVLRKIAAGESEPPPESFAAASAESLSQESSHPLWLVERWAAEYGLEVANAICSQDQRIPKIAIRFDDPGVEAALQAEGVELAPGALLASARTVTGGEITRTRPFHEGRVFIQDEASQLVASLVGSGARLLDCCAAPGGKTAVLAARNPTAEIVALELHPHRVELLRRRVTAAHVQVIAADVLSLPTSGGFDRVLADVPCSGTGTLAHNPEIKWRLKPEALADLHAKQVAILRAALQQLAPGGRAVYSTCSLEREENQAVVEEVLRDQDEYELGDCRHQLEGLRASGELIWPDPEALLRERFLRTIPGLEPCDGFFAAVIERRK